MFVTFLFVIVLIYLLFWYKSYFKKYADIEKLPGPSIKDVISVYSGKSEGLLDFFRSLNKKFGPIAKIWIKPMSPIIVTTDLEFIDKIYKSNEFFYTPAFADLTDLLRNGFATTTLRQSWKNDKQIINRALTPNYVTESLTIYNKKYDEFIKDIYEHLGKPIELESNLYRIQAAVIIEIMADTKVKITPKEINDYIKNKTEYMDLVLEKVNSPITSALYKFTKNRRETLKRAKILIEIIGNILERHKKILGDQREKNNLIYAFIESGMSDDKIIDNVNTMIGGAFETSALTLALTLYELAKQPELQEKILEEILLIFGTQSSQISLNDLNHMIYLNCVVNEALRLFFPSPFLDRLLTHDVQIKDMLIPKDTRVMFQIPEVLKSEEIFKNGKEFNPDRFLPENITENIKKAFIPFGFGDKTCPGKKIASAFMKLFLVKILREFKIYPINDHKIELKSDIMFRSVNGVYVIFQKRVY